MLDNHIDYQLNNIFTDYKDDDYEILRNLIDMLNHVNVFSQKGFDRIYYYFIKHLDNMETNKRISREFVSRIENLITNHYNEIKTRII